MLIISVAVPSGLVGADLSFPYRPVKKKQPGKEKTHSLTVSVSVERDRIEERIIEGIVELERVSAKTIDNESLTGARKIKAEEDHMYHINSNLRPIKTSV